MLNSPSELPARYVVGIDLGTTNCAVCFVDSSEPAGEIHPFLVPQLVAPGEIEARETLPSFSYMAASGEFPADSVKMPWEETGATEFVGVFAREQGKLVPGRVVESAKSWLCHSGVDRSAPLLPWRGLEDVPRRSPVEVSASYLSQIRQAWNHQFSDFPLEQQDVVITLPASFDEVARELTLAAARQAGLPRIVLIEEPQAAFYSWLQSHADQWQAEIQPGQNILVCDIGGGTSDFTLIQVRSHATEKVQFHRVAVGEHLILGGDNLDLSLAHALEARLAPQGRLEPRQWGSLVRLCRQLKETLLGDKAPESIQAVLPGAGSRLIGGGLSFEVTRDETERLLLDGFFPQVDLQARPERQRSGFQEFGLPYAADPAITRHLAAFLTRHLAEPDAVQGTAAPGMSTRPDAVLLNGGAFLSPAIRQRVLDLLQHWYARGEADWRPLLLENPRHDLAVARGAAYYGMVRRNQGVRITAGLPRTYYIGVEDHSSHAPEALQALCLLPAGMESGTEVHLTGHTFALTVAAPVEFPLFHSSLRLTDQPGTLIPVEREQLTPLPPIRTVLRFGKERSARVLNVNLNARLTEIGTLQVWCSEVEGPRTWQLQFDIRSATQTDLTAHAGTGESAGVLEENEVDAVRQLIADTFSPQGTAKPASLAKAISRTVELSRENWPPAFLRQIWEMLLEQESGRSRSLEHECRWLNMLGFSLRPGFGVALDDWRVAETWKRLRGKILHPGPGTLKEWWILWRRIAGGLTAGQQQALALPLLSALRDEARKSDTGRKSRHSGSRHDPSESWRLLAALERLPIGWKKELGELALRQLPAPEPVHLKPVLLWCLGRLGAREPVAGTLNDVIDPETAADWATRIAHPGEMRPEAQLAIMQLARRTGDRYRDLPDGIRQKLVRWLQQRSAPEQFVQLVSEGGALAEETSNLIFGEALPVGLRLQRVSGNE